jgi:hypothetical protein
MAALPENPRRGVQLPGRNYPTKAAPVEQAQPDVLRLAVAARNAFVQIRQGPRCFVDRPGSQMLPKAVEPEFWICYPDEEVQQPISIPFSPKSATRSQVNPERPFEPWPDGRVHARC